MCSRPTPTLITTHEAAAPVAAVHAVRVDRAGFVGTIHVEQRHRGRGGARVQIKDVLIIMAPNSSSWKEEDMRAAKRRALDRLQALMYALNGHRSKAQTATKAGDVAAEAPASPAKHGRADGEFAALDWSGLQSRHLRFCSELAQKLQLELRNLHVRIEHAGECSALGLRIAEFTALSEFSRPAQNAASSPPTPHPCDGKPELNAPAGVADCVTPDGSSSASTSDDTQRCPSWLEFPLLF